VHLEKGLLHLIPQEIKDKGILKNEEPGNGKALLTPSRNL